MQMDLIIRVGDQRPDVGRELGASSHKHESERTIHLPLFVPARPERDNFVPWALPSLRRAAVNHLSGEHRVDAQCLKDRGCDSFSSHWALSREPLAGKKDGLL